MICLLHSHFLMVCGFSGNFSLFAQAFSTDGHLYFVKLVFSVTVSFSFARTIGTRKNWIDKPQTLPTLD